MKKIAVISIILGFLLISTQQSFGLSVTGKVIDEAGAGIAKVGVTVKETGQTTFTDLNGLFRIQADGKHHLKFFHKEYEEQTISLNGKSSLSIVLKLIPQPGEEKEMVMDAMVVSEPQMERKAQQYSNNSLVGGIKGIFVSATMSVCKTAPEWNTENYSSINENGYKNVFDHPLSTFSVDVDNASYSNVRRFLNMGQMPPVDAVRIEEMINYFSYDYELPKNNDPYSINSELTICPWNKDHQLLLVGLRAKEIEKTNLPASNLVFLLDVSGSMQDENKLPLVKSAMRMLVNELRPNDRVAIVVYAGAAGKVLESTPGNQKQKILEAIEKLEAGGSTAGGEGLRLAYQTARENFITGGNNRIILATDGDFNVGVSSNYAYIDNLQEARKMFVKEFGGTLFTVAKDVKFQLEFNPKQVKAYRLIGYENRLLNNEDFKDDKKDAGEMGMGHRVTALYEIVPAGSNEQLPSVDELKYQQQKKELNTKYNSELVTIKTRYKSPDGNRSTQLDKVVSAKAVAFEQASNNIRFASAVAGFGILLRNSEFKGDITWDRVTTIARNAKGNDDEGYKGEFIRLVGLAEGLAQQPTEK